MLQQGLQQAVALYQRIRTEVVTNINLLLLVVTDGRVAWYVKSIPILVLCYFASPIDLIPDLVPIFGWADDALLLPIAIWMAYSLLPTDLRVIIRAEAAARSLPVWMGWVGAGLVLFSWATLAWVTIAAML